MSNVTNLFDSGGGDKPADPNYRYTVTLRDGEVTVGEGYLVIGHGFYAIAKGEGILQDVWPTELIKTVHNDGAVTVVEGTVN